VYWTAENDGIGDEGAIEIAEGLEKNTSLRGLYLGSVFSSFYSSFFVAYSLINFWWDCYLGMYISHFCD
jgi:hypothetical protein